MQIQDSHKYIKEIPFHSLVNWSTSFLLGNNLNYNDRFKLVKIGRLISRNKSKVEIQESANYKRVTIKLYGKGVILRDEVKGEFIGTKNQCKIIPGQFIMSKIDARNGAFGIVPRELDNAIVTQDFMAYDINTNLVIPDFFLLLTTTKRFHELCQQASSGTTGRQRIDETAFLNFQIPLPQIKEQKKLIESYHKKTMLAQQLQIKGDKIESEIEEYIINELGLTANESTKKKGINYVDFQLLKRWDTDFLLSKIAEINSYYPLTSFGNLFYSIRNGIPARNYSEKGLRFLRVTDIKNNSITDNEMKFIDKYKETDLIERNTILITRKGTVGQSFFFKGDKKIAASSEVFIIKLDHDKINGDFFAEVNQTKFIQKQYKERYTGTIMPSMSQSKLQEIRIPIPPISTQVKIARHILARKKKRKECLEKALLYRNQAQEEFESTIFNKE